MSQYVEEAITSQLTSFRSSCHIPNIQKVSPWYVNGCVSQGAQLLRMFLRRNDTVVYESRSSAL